MQSWIISTIVEFLFHALPKKYKAFFNEVGYSYTKSRSKRWLNLDIAVIDRAELSKPTGSYLKVPPEVVIELDTKADLTKIGEEYYIAKTQKLLNSGVKKVVWILTDYKKVQIAENKKPWLVVDFDYEFEIVDNIRMNLKKLLEEEEKQA
ncbi:Uma2 family endonuclease [Persephonella atlantica]|uniref:Uma2 family endonuclease n=1 Tax=Persephonella atlantica TaxID=2699429 RepID=UPI0030844500